MEGQCAEVGKMNYQSGKMTTGETDRCGLSLVPLTGQLSLRAHLAMENHLLLDSVPENTFASKSIFKVVIINTLNASHTNIFRKTAVS